MINEFYLNKIEVNFLTITKQPRETDSRKIGTKLSISSLFRNSAILIRFILDAHEV